MTEFTLDSNLYGQIKDKSLQKSVKDWGGDAENFDGKLTKIAREMTRLLNDTRAIVRKCEDRLKEKGIEKDEKKGIEEVIKQAERMQKRLEPLAAFE